ncbi:MAG: polyprenyl synthetase family protein [Proteobacteria bacterium]|nr:polyprenyl synthetase family protein [Pseudomonadota bacterium]
MNFNDFVDHYRNRVQGVLAGYLPKKSDKPDAFAEAMRYVALSEGKRLRALIVYAAGELFAIDTRILDQIAAAIELIHAYSLVHDDLPDMDNDDFRRGKPTCHKVFGNATAILVGDALQSLAFQVLSKSESDLLNSKNQLHMIRRLAEAIGIVGMAEGQYLDLSQDFQTLSIEQLDHIHRLKTGELFKLCVELVALASSTCTLEQANHLKIFADRIGLAFQIQDDIQDSVEKDKLNYLQFLSLPEANVRVEELYSEALNSLSAFGTPAEKLRELAKMMVLIPC